jgi:hypothetical protein
MKHTNIASKTNLQQLVGHISLFFPIQHCEKKLKAQSIMNNPDAWATLDSRHGTKTNKTKTYTEKE